MPFHWLFEICEEVTTFLVKRSPGSRKCWKLSFWQERLCSLLSQSEHCHITHYGRVPASVPKNPSLSLVHPSPYFYSKCLNRWNSTFFESVRLLNCQDDDRLYSWVPRPNHARHATCGVASIARAVRWECVHGSHNVAHMHFRLQAIRTSIHLQEHPPHPGCVLPLPTTPVKQPATDVSSHPAMVGHQTHIMCL